MVFHETTFPFISSNYTNPHSTLTFPHLFPPITSNTDPFDSFFSSSSAHLPIPVVDSQSTPQFAIFANSSTTPVFATNSAKSVVVHDVPIEPQPQTTPRRSQRVSKPPTYLQSYKYNSIVCAKSTHSNSSIKSGTPYPLSLFLDSLKLSPSYNHFCSLITKTVEPNSYHEVVLDPKWQEAMAVEIAAFDTNNTWTLTSLPPNKKAIGFKWLYKIKHRSDGSVERDKARLAAKGFT